MKSDVLYWDCCITYIRGDRVRYISSVYEFQGDPKLNHSVSINESPADNPKWIRVG